MKKTLSIVITLAMLAACFTAVPAMAKGKKSPALVKSCTSYWYDLNTKKWKKDCTFKYTYKKKYPTRIKITEYAGNKKYGEENIILKYKFKNGKPSSASEVDKKVGYNGVRKYKKGILKKINIGTNDVDIAYKYGKKGFAKQRISRSPDEDSNGKKTTYKYVSNYKVTLKKGVPKKIISTNPAFKGDRFYSEYNSKGLVTLRKNAYEGKSLKTQVIVKYKIKNGKAVSALVWENENSNGTGRMLLTDKYVFKYTKTKISKQRYSQMINQILGYKMDENDDYMAFLWY